jgi:hypothetical protein
MGVYSLQQAVGKAFELETGHEAPPPKMEGILNEKSVLNNRAEARRA